MLRFAFATGTEPGKWCDRFAQRTRHGGIDAHGSDDPLGLLESGRADLALVRLPDARMDDRHHRVLLYTEACGVAVPKESIFAEVGEPVTAADLEGQMVQYRLADSGAVDVPAVRAALQVVAANVGVAIAPRPLLKILSRKQVVPLELRDDAVPQTQIALVWPRLGDSEAIQDFVGIARGRTANSSRQAAPKRSAREKTRAKQQARRGSQRDKRVGQRRRKR
ncbi:LysR family transcriptional regulator substrate-binding protein [Corynebacterium sp. zg-331]|uniref:LysR family transcriptional regulator substrate-binding protein n=1 Tax=unclassified Corynebacterium TaxID=2624378 RepID=UPI00128E5422|nr:MULTISPECIES: LysR family transcriptional regulator substrate-binding protein [unclassified Corynebacterium]MBC3186749.1 LysR family transcriptional regulator substrate-binding protein [Corynebacterium sp. zg-331]MPV53231.1 LysR family transcriptional regulator [Corynebacterium sp. zg331]